MPKTRLTDLSLRSFPTPDKGTVDYWDLTLPNFGCRVSQGGARTFILKLYNSRRALGRYPIISLAEARAEARRQMAEKTLGKLRPEAVSYQEAVKVFLEEKRKSRRVRTADDYEYYLERFFVFKCPLADVSHADICRKLGRIKKQSLYNHALAAVRGFFNWCQKKKRYITDNPVTGIDPYKRPKRKRVLTDQELRAVWLACENPDSEMPEHFRTIVKLQVLLGQRRSETAALQRAYYSHNQQAICLPAEVVKNGVEHTFPVGDMGAEVLRPLLSAEGLLFLARGKSNRPFSGWSKAKKQLDIESGVADWTLHDLRRTFRTGLSRLGVAPHISERLVNHVTAQTEVERTYDLYKFFPEMQDAMTKWQSHVAAIIKQDIATAA